VLGKINDLSFFLSSNTNYFGMGQLSSSKDISMGHLSSTKDINMGH
jgi:hypothetical protein